MNLPLVLVSITAVIAILGLLAKTLALKDEQDRSHLMVEIYDLLWSAETREQELLRGHLKGLVTTGNNYFGLGMDRLEMLDKNTYTRIRKFKNALDSAEKYCG